MSIQCKLQISAPDQSFRRIARRFLRVPPPFRKAIVGLFLCALIGFAYWPPPANVVAAQTDAKAQAAKQPATKTKKHARPKKPVEPPFDQTPYRVQINLAFENAAAMPPDFRARVMRRLKDEVAGGYGVMWDAEYIANTWLSPPTKLGLERLSADALLERYPKSRRAGLPGYDKVFFVTVESSGAAFRISSREWDVRSQRFGNVETATTWRRDRVAANAFDLLAKAFRPVFKVQSVDNYNVEYQLRAAMLPPVDPNLAQVKPGDVIVPYFRYLDENYTAQRVQVLPWTYTIVQDVRFQTVNGTLISAFYSPLGSGRRRRVELLGTRIRPRGQSSRLKMVYQTDETKALVGYNITLVRKFFPRDESTVPKLELFSGRDGYVDVPVDLNHPVTWVYVYSGKALLARVPYVAGVVEEETIPLPDDSLRLAVEGDLAILYADLIDTIARRATLMALAIMDFNDPKLVDKDAEKRKRINAKIDKIQELTQQRHFLERLAVIRGPRLAAAKRLGNRFAVRRIERMCGKAEELIKAYLKPSVVDQFIEDIETGKYEQKK